MPQVAPRLTATAAAGIGNTRPSPLPNKKYVIQLEAGETPGTFLVRSPLYDAYMGAIDGNSKVITAVDKAAAAEYLIDRVSGSLFNLSNEGISQGVHAQEAGKSCVGWNKTADASQWEFETVPDNLLEVLRLRRADPSEPHAE
mgnify:CR=1 FL=1